jgi:hypothetical protein
MNETHFLKKRKHCFNSSIMLDIMIICPAMREGYVNCNPPVWTRLCKNPYTRHARSSPFCPQAALISALTHKQDGWQVFTCIKPIADDVTNLNSFASFYYWTEPSSMICNTSLRLITKGNSVAIVRRRNIPTERPPLAGELSANFCG